MADTDLRANCAPVIPEFSRIYNHYRYRKALAEAVMYDPAYDDCDPPAEIIAPLEDEHLNTLEAMIQHPVDQPVHLHLKLEVYKAEGMYNGWRNADRIASTLADDAERVMETHACLKSSVS